MVTGEGELIHVNNKQKGKKSKRVTGRYTGKLEI